MTPSPATAISTRWPPSAFSAALIATLVGFGGTIALIVRMGQSLGASPLQITSSVTALCLGIAIGGAWLSWRLRIPVVLAWSTPGAALLATTTLPGGYAAAVGAFAFAAALMVLLGLVPALGRLAARIPATLASGMLAGVLLPFCLAVFGGGAQALWLVLPALLVFIVMRQRAPAYAVLGALLAVIVAVLIRDQVGALPAFTFGRLQTTLPALDLAALISVGLPLFLVTLASQNLPGFAVLRSAGYELPTGPALRVTGLASLLLAPFGAHAVNLAAITAAICTDRDAHPDATQRWRVAIIYAALYALLAAFSAPLVALFMALPTQAVATIAGLALLAPLSGALLGMLQGPAERAGEREAALLCFVATASGLTLWGIGAAFWGLMLGFAALGARRLLAR